MVRPNKFRIAMWVLLVCIWYFIIVLQISSYFSRQATDCYIKASELFLKGQINEGKGYQIEGDLYSKKARSVRKLVPF